MEVKHVGVDYWNRNLYRSTKTNKEYVNVDGVLHTMTDEGEPCTPVVPLAEVTVVSQEIYCEECGAKKESSLIACSVCGF